MLAGGSHAGGCFRWRCFPRIHAIAGCIGDGSGTCHLLIAQRGYLWFLHILGSYWTTCRDPVIPHVSFLLAHMLCLRLGHVSLLHWTKCLFLLVHVASIECPHLCRFLTRPSAGLGMVPISMGTNLPASKWTSGEKLFVNWFIGFLGIHCDWYISCRVWYKFITCIYFY
jgi:hypothetical protein